MKSKIVTFLFILAAAILAGIFFATKKLVVNNDKSLTRAKIVNPKSVSSNNAENDSTKNIKGELLIIQSFIQLSDFLILLFKKFIQLFFFTKRILF